MGVYLHKIRAPVNHTVGVCTLVDFMMDSRKVAGISLSTPTTGAHVFFWEFTGWFMELSRW